MVIYSRLEVSSTDHKVLVYKIDKSYTEFSIKFSLLQP